MTNDQAFAAGSAVTARECGDQTLGTLIAPQDLRDRPAGSRDFHAAIIKGDERVQLRTPSLGRWTLWTLAAALPLGCAAFFLAKRWQPADDFEDWWSQRERVRANGHRVAPGRASARRDDLFV